MATDPEPRGELTGRLWLFLLKAGGRWMSRDVADGAGCADRRTEVSWLLAAMARYGQVKKYPIPGMARRFMYGVTGDCRIPAAVTVERISEAVLAEAPDAVEETT